VQIVTAPDMRGRGIARALIEHSALAMFQHGFERLYARVWLTNHPSRAAFAAAGWRQIALVMEVNPLRRARPLRINWGQRPKASA
jgi:RimJ/RimL family protein N-acetyltransferase